MQPFVSRGLSFLPVLYRLVFQVQISDSASSLTSLYKSDAKSRMCCRYAKLSTILSDRDCLPTRNLAHSLPIVLTTIVLAALLARDGRYVDRYAIYANGANRRARQGSVQHPNAVPYMYFCFSCTYSQHTASKIPEGVIRFFCSHYHPIPSAHSSLVLTCRRSSVILLAKKPFWEMTLLAS